MSLSGNLSFVSLDEVLRLLARSQQRGAVNINGEKVRGRVFVAKGAVGLATTFDDRSLRNHLFKSGLVDEGQLQALESGSGFDKTDDAITELLREMTVESLYTLGMHGESFEVNEGATSPYASAKPFELEGLIADSKQRLSDWAEVRQAVTDLDAVLRMQRELGDRTEVTIGRDAWKVLSEIRGGRSIVGLAEELGTTEFWVARVAAGLIDGDLLAIMQVDQGAEPVPVAWSEPEPAASTWGEPETVNPDQSWWSEPESEDQADAESEDAGHEDHIAEETERHEEDEQVFAAGADEPAAAEHSDDSDDSHGGSEVEDDTEAFLERVFSELETPSEDEGYGLLRRRRMGTLRDVASDG